MNANLILIEWARFCSDLLWRGGCPFLLGVLAKTGDKTWCFCGEFVVDCVVNVVLLRTVFCGRRMGQGFWIYF
jgi:hypothetical protein